MTGSLLAMASSSPFRTAATAPELRPTLITETSSGLIPALAKTNLRNMSLPAPGEEIPTRIPFRSLGDL